MSLTDLELKYVKRKKRKKAAKIISFIGAVGIIVYIILAFLGKKIGTFSIQLENDKVVLTLAKNSADFLMGDTTTYLRVDNMPKIESWCYEYFEKNDITDDVLHNENNDFRDIATVSGKQNSVYFFKYTFIVGNIGSVNAFYDVKIRIAENNLPSNYAEGAASLDNYLRVGIYTTYDIGKTEERTTVNYYAKMAETGTPTYDKSGNLTMLEHIGSSASPYVDYAFKDENTIANYEESVIAPGDYRMYTLVFWFENFDPQHGPVVPTGGSLKLGVDINAYAYSQKN